MTSKNSRQTQRSDEERIDRENAKHGGRLMLEAVGEDPERDGLLDTSTTTRATVGSPIEAEREQFQVVVARSEGNR